MVRSKKYMIQRANKNHFGKTVRPSLQGPMIHQSQDMLHLIQLDLDFGNPCL